MTHLERRLLGVHDRKVRRCWLCGEWAWHLDDCKTCEAPAERPNDFNKEQTA